jgi:hypothetical protein
VSSFRSPQAKASDVGEDFVSGLDPDEGHGMFVMDGQEQADGIFQGASAAVGAAPELLVGEQSEPRSTSAELPGPWYPAGSVSRFSSAVCAPRMTSASAADSADGGRSLSVTKPTPIRPITPTRTSTRLVVNLLAAETILMDET